MQHKTNARTLLSAAMALSLAGCAAPSAQVSPELADLPRAHQSEVQLAAAQNHLSRLDVPQPVIPTGQVVLTRTEEAQPGPTTEDVQKELRDATARVVVEARAAADAAIAKARQDALAEIDNKFERMSGQTSQLLTQTTEVLRANTAATTAAKQSADVQQQLNLATAMAVAQARQEAIAQARKEAATAVADAKKQAVAEVEERFRNLSGQTNQLLAQTSNLLNANGQVLATTGQVIEGNRAVLANTNQVLAANTVAQQNVARQQLKNWQQAEQIKRMAEEQTAQIREKTDTRLNILASHVSQTLAQIAQNAVRPEEAQAIALATVANSKDFIRTQARSAVQDNDPAMQTALANAARNVITKDDRVVFAIRKAVADQLYATPGQSLASVSDTTVDSNALTIGALQNPGGVSSTYMEAALAMLSPAAGPGKDQVTGKSPAPNALRNVHNRRDWIDLRKYHVVVHEDSKTLEQLLNEVLNRAAPFTGPWQIKWKLSDENKDLMQERFSLDVETSFDDFVSYLAQYMVNDRGIKMTFNLFDADRIIVVSD